MGPLVSIGVPFFNAQDFILETLNSIKAQTYANIELILVDDCCQDESLCLVKDWLNTNATRFAQTIILQNEQNQGTAQSCKKLAEAASGDFFCKIDADDTMLPERISQQVKFLLANPEAALVYANTLLMDEKGKILNEDYFDVQNFQSVCNKRGPSGSVFGQLIREDFIPNSSVLVRKVILDEIGGYDASLFTEDWDLWLRISKVYPIHFMDGYFSVYRIHSQSVMRKSTSLVKMYRSSANALLKHQSISKEFDKVIAKHLFTYVVGMYRFGVIDKKLLKVTFLANKTGKAGLYYLLGILGVKVNQKQISLPLSKNGKRQPVSTT
ncbi:MAG TPA: glycosyltransferase family A protein [Flavisolibacter sp.]|jgi:glycosyltransferase involved in cell wall biosynthesis|nr:glycosyltransferase family A protein [Flavisolibacter sp.]